MTNHTPQDPFAQREAEKYENPIPSREYIIDLLRDAGRLMQRHELIEVLDLQTPDEQEGLRRRLRAMERDGQLIFTRRGGYGLPEKMDLIRGRVIGHKDGFGFVAPDDGSHDLFLSAYQMRSVFDRDKVIVRKVGEDRRGRREAAIVEILERNTHTVVGRFLKDGEYFFVTPSNKRITQDVLIPKGQENNAKPGQIVVAEITTQPTLRIQAAGRVVEILGEHLAPGMEIDVAMRSYGIPNHWPEEVTEEIKKFSPEVLEKDKKKRVDLRHLPFVTIDGEDAKDFDDAVYAEKRKRGGWKLYVAIADVSHYVKRDSALDIEAMERGNSVYFPGSVIPMLPEILSNQLCSLRPKVDRLCLVCEMDISSSGKLNSSTFHEAIIHSQARLIYTEVANILENPKAAKTSPHQSVIKELKELFELYKVLRVNREKRGAIDFEKTETRVVFGENRKIEQIVPVERTLAHRIIEECMLMANVAAANFVLEHQLPALFRVHEGPAEEKLNDLRAFLGGLGLSMPGRKIPKPKDYAEILKKIMERPDAHLIQTVLLRSLSQAVYSPDNNGHFGLAFPAYTHFTSPIRRYPDLLIHRTIRYALKGGKPKSFFYDHAALVKFGDHSSVTERRADEATRDAMDSLKCEFIKQHLGEEFPGIITNVMGFGFFVELQNIYIDGLVHVTALKNDYYHFDALKRCLRGERSGTIYRLGDQVKVKVVRVDIEKREIDFDLVGDNEKKKSISKKKIVQKKDQKNTVPKKESKKKVSINKNTIKNKAAKRNHKNSSAVKKKKR